MYQSLPNDFLDFVVPTLYFPYFGSLRTATHATFGINCGPPEAVFDSLGLRELQWNVTMTVEETNGIINNPPLVERPKYYFRFGQNGTPPGLGHPRPDGFWSFFNCGGIPDQNPLHREHYYAGSLVHLDAVPWATIHRWADVHPDVQIRLLQLAIPVFRASLETAENLRSIFIRGRTAAEFLERTGVGLRIKWDQFAPKRSVGKGMIRLTNGRCIEVRAVNQFNNITAEAARALIEG